MGRWTTRLALALAVLLAVGFVGLSAFGGYLWWNRDQLAAEQQTRDELGPCTGDREPPDCGLAAEQIPLVFGYDFQTVERSLTDAYQLLTPAYRREFEERANQDIIPQARDRQVISQANVVGTGVLDAHRDSASVLVFMNRTITDKSKQPVYDGSRLRVDYERVDGQWKINFITPI
jgi:Mce-associated membrane protein